MVEKLLGKIDFAEYGKIRDYPFLIGLQLGFSLSGEEALMDGGKYTANISKNCNWGDRNRAEEVTKNVEYINKILNDAKACHVSELIGKPVEVTTENGRFKDFRILTEVL